MKLSEQLKSDLRAERYYLKDLAHEADTTSSQLSQWLGGHYRPSWRAAQGLATAATKLTGKTYTPIMFLEIKP